MIYDVALGVRTTIARIDAQVVYTGSVTRAIAVRSTFGYNFRCKINIHRKSFANRVIYRFCYSYRHINFLKFKTPTWNTVASWITNVVGRTSTDWTVIVRVT